MNQHPVLSLFRFLGWTILLLEKSTNATTLPCGENNDFIKGYFSSKVSISGIDNDCSDTEKAGIAHLLQDGMDYIMGRLLAGISRSSNEICKKPTVERDEGKQRNLFQENAESGVLGKTVHDVDDKQPARQTPRQLQNEGEYSFVLLIFRGTGDCTFCLPRNSDGRRRHLRKLLRSVKKYTEKATKEGEFASFRDLSPNTLPAEKRKLSVQHHPYYEKNFLDQIRSARKDLVFALEQPKESINYKKDILRVFAAMLIIAEGFIGFQLTSLIYYQYVQSEGHCLYLQEPLVNVELTYENEWKEPECTNDEE